MLESAPQQFEKAQHHLESELSKLQLGRATPTLVESIQVEQYGSLGPIKNCASINVLDPQTLTIVPWDKTLIHTIAKAISDAGTGLNPQTMADSVMIKIPQLTEERRKEMCKIVKRYGEDAKVSVRNIRGDLHKKISQAETEKEINEDDKKRLETELQKMVDTANTKIEETVKKKEADVMKV